MIADYNFSKIEKKWQKEWEKTEAFKAVEPPLAPVSRQRREKEKYYILVEFPYPSGLGLHVGHPRPYIGMDVLARKRRMQGYNVMFPMGWDAFGLPTENYSIKTGIHPRIATKENTATFKRQQKALGLSFDWSREIDTTNPKYYKWTQWIFIQLFKNGLAYKKKMPINWCLSCQIGLANEEVLNGKCERCGGEVTSKIKEQWMLEITKYADRLLADLDKVDYPERVKISQKEWIGKSHGAQIDFKIGTEKTKEKVTVFTTRADTLFGCTYLVLAPDHRLVEKFKDDIKNYKDVSGLIGKLGRKTKDDKEKTGVELKGIKAINPANNLKVPVFVADYVLSEYGTGAIMAVPAHDERDLEFAQKYDQEIIEVINDQGVLINSGKFSGLSVKEAQKKIVDWLTFKEVGKATVAYKLRDWVFSRQRYWGEPIPMIYCQQCAGPTGGQGWQPVKESDLPIELPEVKNYKPTKEGDSPLSKNETWIKTKCPECGGKARRETDVMPNWAGSNWYFLRYCDPKNNKKLASPGKLEHWMPVDWYNGGMEHTTLHLLYSRFIYKFLWDIGAVPKKIGSEPYKKRTSHGLILGEKGIKMSKSRGNVINPDDIIKDHGADSLRVYEMFMGPFEQTIAWDTKGLKGASRFLEKVWDLQEVIGQKDKLDKLVGQTVKKVTEDIDNLRFNTAISSLMILVNKMGANKGVSLQNYTVLLNLLGPFAPHLSSEIKERLKIKDNDWPEYDRQKIKEDTYNLIIQINGKVKDKAILKIGATEKAATKTANDSARVKKALAGKKIKKTIFVKDKLINFVI